MLFNYFDKRLPIEKAISKEIGKKSILEEEQKKKLYSLLSNYIYNHSDYIPKNNIKYCLQLSDNKIFEIIFSFFGRKKEKNEYFELEDLEYLYNLLTSNNPNVMAVFFAFFIFYNKEKLTYVEITKNTTDLFQRDIDVLKWLIELNYKMKEKYELDNNSMNNENNINNINNKTKKKKIKNEEITFNRKDYLNEMKEKGFIKDFKFIKRLYGSSETKHLFKDNNELDYVCDCRKAQIQEKIENNLDSMKGVFDTMTKDTNNLLNLNNFENILKYNRIHQTFINFVMEYLRKYTQKEFCCFNDLKHIFSKLDYSLPLNEKKKFLFEMILTICGKEGKINNEQIDKYLNSELYDNENKINQETREYFDEESFLENNGFDNMINNNKFIGYFGLIPYLEFKIKANDKEVKEKLVRLYLKNEGIEEYEKYLERNFENNEIFYAINYKFWESLLDEEKKSPEYINNEEIADELNIIKDEEKIQKEIEDLQNKINSEIENKKNKKNKKSKNKDDSNKEKETEPNKNNAKNSNEKNEEINKKEGNIIKDNTIPKKDSINKSKEKKIEIVTKRGKLKKGLKLNQDFILLCGDLYQLLKTNYQIDYEIILKRKQTYIQLNKNKKEESKEKGSEKENDIKEKEEGKENEKKEKEKQKEEIAQDKEKESDDTKKIENKENEQEKEDNIQKEQLIKEKLDKFSIDKEKGLISIIRKNDDQVYSLYELDFYPIQIFIKTFGEMVRLVEKAKVKYDDLDNQKKILEKPKKQRINEIKKKEKKEKELQKKVTKYKQSKYDLDEQFQYQQISQNIYRTKLKKLKEQYKDIFQKPEKTPNDYEVEISLHQFKAYLERYKNTLLLDHNKEIGMYPRYKTYKDFLDDIFILDCTLKGQKYDIYYYLFNSKKLIKVNANDNYSLDDEDFVNIIIDRPNEKGETFYQLLKKKDDDQKWTELNLSENDKNKNEKDGKALSKEDKEKERQEKAERQRKEKEEKERLKKLQDEEEKKLKEEQKKWAQQEKERKRKEKEEKEKQKKEQKERELEEQRQREREKFVSPPFGIHNYGNTCYFNSVNQIFFNLPILQQIFLDPRIEYFVNKENKFGHQGKFFEIYKSLYWIKPTKIGSTVKSLKAKVGELKEDFNNNRQQDANEYLNFVLENLHEELNLHSAKKYIEEKDDIFKHNTVEELGNISWANNLRRNLSFIDSIFMFQLRSNLKCKKCNNVKYNFETNYIFDLPLSLCRMVTVEIYLYRLPLRYKLYFDKINKDFENYINKDENKDLNISENLWNYYTNELKDEQKKQHINKLHFSFDLERDKNMMDIIRILRGIKILELEPEDMIQTYKSDEMVEYKVQHLTDLITYSKEKNKIIYPNSEIDKYVNMEDKIILNVYEILNSNGMQKLFEEKNKNIEKPINLYSYSLNSNKHLNLDEFRNIFYKTNFSQTKNIIKNETEKESISTEKDTSSENKINENGNKIIEDKEEHVINEKKKSEKTDTINIISLKDRAILFPKEKIDYETGKSRRIFTEFALPIFHYYRSNKNSTYLFRDFYHEKLNSFPVQYVLLNNNYNISSKQLYEYVWNLNILYMNHPKIDTSKFWWNNYEENSEEEENNNDNTNYKKCYPFVLRYLELPEKPEYNNLNLIHCPLCPWYSFCPGCIIDPKGELKRLDSNFGIVVDWCTSFIQEEFSSYNFKLCKDIESQTISENLPIFDKDQAYQSIKDCFDLFFVEENLEDPLMCHQCGGPQDFTKKYSINKLPYVLILSLKRFKFNQNSNFKLRQMITYPLYDLELGGKKYDLYGVVNHYGSLSSGHYTAIIKKNKDWVLCNDSSVSKIEEKRVMHSNAYILFYICKESPYQNDYFKFMKSIMNNIVIKDKKNAVLKPDLNFFKGEPVKTEYGEGYIVEENLVDFKADENHDIYDDLKKKDKLRIEDIIKKEKENDKKNKKDDKKSEKNEDKENKKEDVKDVNKDNEKKNEVKDKKESKENKENKESNENKENKESNEKNEDENKINNNINEINQLINTLINKIINDVVENVEQKGKNEIKEKNENNNKIVEEKEDENNKQKDVEKEENKNIISNENTINEIKEENQNNINLNKDEEKVSLPDYYKDFVQVKFDYGKGSILKKNVYKNNHILNVEKDDKKEEKKGEKKEEKNKKK